MNYLVYEVDVDSSDLIEVTLDKQANVRLLDYSNYQNYRNGKEHRYYGGHAEKSPVRLRAPSRGHWYVVVDLGGYAGTVTTNVNIIRGK